MDWEFIKLILEIVGTIALIATLIYLAKQVKDNTRIAAANSRQSISDSYLENTITYFSDIEFRKTFNKHLKGQKLDPEELLYLDTYCYFFFRSFENIHYQFRSKLVSKEDWAAYRTNLKGICQAPALQNFWNRESENFNRSFHQEVNKIFTELESEPKLMPDALFHPKSKD